MSGNTPLFPVEFQWADEERHNSMPTPAELEERGWKRGKQHPRFLTSWLMWRPYREELT